MDTSRFTNLILSEKRSQVQGCNPEKPLSGYVRSFSRQNLHILQLPLRGATVQNQFDYISKGKLRF